MSPHRHRKRASALSLSLSYDLLDNASGYLNTMRAALDGARLMTSQFTRLKRSSCHSDGACSQNGFELRILGALVPNRLLARARPGDCPCGWRILGAVTIAGGPARSERRDAEQRLGWVGTMHLWLRT